MRSGHGLERKSAQEPEEEGREAGGAGAGYCRGPDSLDVPEQVAQGSALLRGLADAPHPSAPLHSAGVFPRATGSIPGLPGSSLDQPPEKTAEVGQHHGWGSGDPGEGAGPDADSQGTLGL